MGQILTDLGEEYLIKNGIDGVSLSVGLYDDSTDAITDTEDLSDITTEPAGASYARQSDTFAAGDFSGDWGTDNNNQISFDLSDTSTGDVDGWFMVANFQASDTGDGAATDHLIATGSLSQSYVVSSVDTLNISAGGVGFTVS